MIPPINSAVPNPFSPLRLTAQQPERGVSDSRRKLTHHYRTDQCWIQELTGRNGIEAWYVAHADLAAYLYVVVVNSLKNKHAKRIAFDGFTEEEVTSLAGDFVQDFMVKMTSEGYALLDKYSGTGRFTSWSAQVMHNLIASELRRAHWRREIRESVDEMQADQVASEDEYPEAIAIRHSVGEILMRCLERLPTHYRAVIERCILQNESAVDIAQEEQVTVNAIYIRLHRAKDRLRTIALEMGLEANSLAI